jgi:hypothetical protein
MAENDVFALSATPVDPTTYVPEQDATLRVQQSPDESPALQSREIIPDVSVGQQAQVQSGMTPTVAVTSVAPNEFRITLDGRQIGRSLTPHEAPVVKSWMESVLADGGV